MDALTVFFEFSGIKLTAVDPSFVSFTQKEKNLWPLQKHIYYGGKSLDFLRFEN